MSRVTVSRVTVSAMRKFFAAAIIVALLLSSVETSKMHTSAERWSDGLSRSLRMRFRG